MTNPGSSIGTMLRLSRTYEVSREKVFVIAGIRIDSGRRNSGHGWSTSSGGGHFNTGSATLPGQDSYGDVLRSGSS